jgi:5-methyltetrahydrofolate--homocysteine methyltransferase
MKRRGMSVPLLIGGATTSAKHTAVKIAPQYDQPTVHVLDASRCVGVVDRLLSSEGRPAFVEYNTTLQQQLVASYEQRQVKLAPLAEAREKRFHTDWSTVRIDRPSFTGTRVIEDLPLSKLVPLIDWSPFFLTWELKGKYPKIFEDENLGEVARKLFDDAQALLDRIVKEKLLTARGVYGFWPAASEADDIIVYTDESRSKEQCRFHALRQQWERKGQGAFYSLADFIAPAASGRKDYLGAFAVTAGIGCDELAAKFDRELDDYNSILTKALADRLAEAFAEYLHAQVRRDWGYGKSDKFTVDELVEEKYRGIRPAPGYPAQPDHTEKRTLFGLLDAERAAGIKLTEHFAMHPAASVSGLYFAHPESRYFAVDRLTRDQVEDYAGRKGMSVTEIERWLAPNLGYEP